MTTTLTLERVKARQQQTWSSGDYNQIARFTVPLADVLVDAVDLRAEATVLDVATGTGHMALAAARHFCDVTGIDYVPALLDIARGRAAAEALEINFREADAEALPFRDGSFDYVLSVVGVMFTANQEQAASELARVCRPGGVIGLANWTPTGFVGEMFKTVATHAPPPPGVKSPLLWGTEARMHELLGKQASKLTFTTRTIVERFPSAEFYADFFIEHFGPTKKAWEALTAGRERHALRDDLVALVNRRNQGGPGTVACEWEYLVAVATRS